MGGISIDTPKDVSFSSGGQTGKLKWKTGFATGKTSAFNKAQEYVDSEVLRLCSPLVPFDTGMLEKSGTLGTTIGSGEVHYTAPYAAYQYYSTAQTRSYDSNRGSQWFERMKASNLDAIKDGAGKLAGG